MRSLKAGHARRVKELLVRFVVGEMFDFTCETFLKGNRP